MISQSKEMSKEYCATVVRLEEVNPVENSDFLGVTSVQGRDIVVRRDSVHENQVMIYVSNECQLNCDFLSKNNEFEDISFNSNYDRIRSTVEDYKKQIAEIPYTLDDPRTVAMRNALEDELKIFLQNNRGYFDKHGRVRMKKLRGTMSMGYLISPEAMTVFDEKLADFDWESHVGEDFDTVNDVLFVKAYVPETREHHTGTGKGRAEKKIKKFNRMIPGQFAFHYDTQQLQTNMDRLRPNSDVSITVKLHGTSDITGNVKVKQPKFGGLYTKYFNYIPSFLQFTKEGYDVVYSSRTVIKNDTLNPGVSDGFYGVDVWNDYYQILKDVLPQGVTIYGEIVGYITGTNRGIQSLGGKVYDYGCKPGTNKLMIYRVKKTEKTGEVYEFNINQVLTETEILKQDLIEAGKSEYAERIVPITVLYNGPLSDLYPDLTSSDDFKELLKERESVEGETDEQKQVRETHNRVLTTEVRYMNDWISVNQKTINDFISEVVSKDSLIYKAWQKALLNRLKTDKNFYMEMNEPLCKNELPREGIVLRINNDPIAEAFKLKTLRFLAKEATDVDSGKTDDVEMQERYA